MATVKERLQDIFRDVFDKKDLEIDNSMTANDIEEWDSLMHINLIIAIEKEFSIKLAVTELIQLKNIGDAIRLIEKSLAKKDSR